MGGIVGTHGLESIFISTPTGVSKPSFSLQSPTFRLSTHRDSPNPPRVARSLELACTPGGNSEGLKFGPRVPTVASHGDVPKWIYHRST